MARGPFRSFTEDFCKHMNQDPTVWPHVDSVNAMLVANKHGKMHSGAYAAIKNGDVRAERYLIAVLSCMLMKSNAPEIVTSREALFDYLRHLGRKEPESMDVKPLVELVCDQPQNKREDKNLKDEFERWLDDAINVLNLKRPVVEYVSPCKNAAAVRRAVDWMFIEAGRAVGGKRLSREEARREAESLINIDFPNYVENAIKWHARIPWTVVWAHGERKRVGMCLNLPVPGDIYDAVRQGLRSSHSLTDQELEVPAKQLIAEGFAFRPHEQRDGAFGGSKAMFYAVFCQQARLTDIPFVGWNFPMRLLSFAATKANTRRLKWVGYKPTGTQKPVSGLALYERVFHGSILSGWKSRVDSNILCNWWNVQALLRQKFGPV